MEDAKPAPMSQLDSREDMLRRVQTADSVFLPREVFEALYLSPKRQVAGDLRKRVCPQLWPQISAISLYLICGCNISSVIPRPLR